MFHTIMVPLDGSPLSEQALPVAARLARASDAALHLVHVHVPYSLTPISIEGLPVIDEELHSLASAHERAYLEQAARQADGLKVTTSRLEGPVVPTLTEHAHTIGADLIVLTSHGHSGFAHLWLGSVAEHLIRTTGVPLLMLRPRGEGVEPAAFRRILVTLDGSALAEAILPHAQALAGAEGGGLHLLRVIDYLPVPEVMPYAEHYRLDEAALEEQRAQASAYLRRVAEGLPAGLSVETSISEGKQPARAIIAAAGEGRYDLVALATHGRSGLSRTLLGSVADKVLRGIQCAALIYRPPAVE